MMRIDGWKGSKGKVVYMSIGNGRCERENIKRELDVEKEGFWEICGCYNGIGDGGLCGGYILFGVWLTMCFCGSFVMID